MIKYIFSINTGRSGSGYLSELFSHVEDTVSLHEQKPKMHSHAMRAYLKGKPEMLVNKMTDKIKAIQSAKGEHSLFVETNHSFIKGYGYLMPKYIPSDEIGVIHLTRDKDEIVRSFMRINTTPIAAKGREWLMTPEMKNPMIQVSKWDQVKFKMYVLIEKLFVNKFTWNYLSIKRTNFFKAFEKRMLEWYVDETNEQAGRFKNLFPEIRVYEVDVKALNSVEDFQKILDFFQITNKIKPSMEKVVGVPINLKKGIKL